MRKRYDENYLTFCRFYISRPLSRDRGRKAEVDSERNEEDESVRGVEKYAQTFYLVSSPAECG